MYDRAETRGANDRLWSLIARQLEPNAPKTLSRGADPWDQWQSRDLLLSQTCGLPYRAKLSETVSLVGTPNYDLPCSPGHYFSAIVVRRDDPRATLRDFRAARLADNVSLIHI